MKLEFTVHNTGDTKVSRRVTLDGKEVLATVDGYRVELTHEPAQHSSFILRFTDSEEIAEAKKIFLLNEKVTFTV